MHILLLKTSSFGDIIHTLPAVTDAALHIAQIRVDWLVESDYQELVSLHPAVKAIPVDCKRWLRQRLNFLDASQNILWDSFLADMQRSYDAIIDAQGLVKSAWLLRYTKGHKYGYDRQSVRERMASFLYDTKISVAKKQHAVMRNQQLFATALGYADTHYQPTELSCEYGISQTVKRKANSNTTQLLFVHATRWPTKHWPITDWRRLAALCVANGWRVYVPHHTLFEQQQAEQIAAAIDGIELLAVKNIGTTAQAIASMDCVVSLDSGLSHLTAALGVPNICLFGATDYRLTRPYGAHQIYIKSRLECSPCMSKKCRIAPQPKDHWPPCMVDITVDAVFTKIVQIIERAV